MLERKGLPYRYVELPAGTHPAALWALGFRAPTVPAMRLADGRRVQGSLAIARALEALAPQPSLYQDAAKARPAERLAYRLVPDVPPIPAALPPEWVPGVATGSPAHGPGTRAATRS